MLRTIIVNNVGPRGATGATGIPEDDMIYSTRYDFIGNTMVYRGEAAVGSLNSGAFWRIRRITMATDGDATTEWANGNANFTNVWDNRLSLSYN